MGELVRWLRQSTLFAGEVGGLLGWQFESRLVKSREGVR